MIKTGRLFGFPEDLKNYKTDEYWILPKCVIGLEFEVEGVPFYYKKLQHKQERNHSFDGKKLLNCYYHPDFSRRIDLFYEQTQDWSSTICPSFNLRRTVF